MNMKIKLLLTFAFAFLIVTGRAYSQTALEQAVRESDIMKEELKAKREQLKKVPEKAPEIEIKERPPLKEEKKFFVKKINLVGCESFSPQDFSVLTNKYENKEVTFTELDNLCKEIEQEYIKRGIVAAVFIPQQEIINQTITLQVVEARMGELQINDHKYFKKNRLSYYWKVKQDEILRYDKVSQSLQEMNKNPDRKVRAVLHAGKKPRTTDVLLEPKTTFPVHLISSYDREGVIASGKSRTGVGFKHNNLLGLDDTLIGGTTFGNDFNGEYAYHSIPITGRGTNLIYGYSHSSTRPKKDVTEFGIKSLSDSYSISLHQDIFKKADYLGDVYAGFEANDKTIKVSSEPANRDRLRIFNIGTSLQLRSFGSVTIINPEVFQGVDAFGASQNHNPMASRGAHSLFTKFNLALLHKRILPFGLQTNLKFKSQVSSTKLTPQEEFNLGGIDSVRGYPAADYQADNGINTSIEILSPAFFLPRDWKCAISKEPLRDIITPLIFVDYGWGMRRGALPTEKREVSMLGAGAGIRFKLFNKAYLRLEWGFPLGDRPLTQGGHSQFHFAVDFET